MYDILGFVYCLFDWYVFVNGFLSWKKFFLYKNLMVELIVLFFIVMVFLGVFGVEYVLVVKKIENIDNL